MYDSPHGMNDSTLKELARLATRGDLGAWHEVAQFIRRTGDYRWVGLYQVTDTEIRAVAWTGSAAPAFPWFPRERGLNGPPSRPSNQ